MTFFFPFWTTILDVPITFYFLLFIFQVFLFEESLFIATGANSFFDESWLESYSLKCKRLDSVWFESVRFDFGFVLGLVRIRFDSNSVWFLIRLGLAWIRFGTDRFCSYLVRFGFVSVQLEFGLVRTRFSLNSV